MWDGVPAGDETQPMRRLLSILLAALAAWLVYMIATGRIYIARVDEVRAAAETVELQYVCWGDVTEDAMNQHWLDAFQNKHPNIKAKKILTSGGVGTREKIQTLMAGGSPPDVMYVWPEVFPEFAARGVYLPLNEFMERDQVNGAEWFQPLIDFYTIDDIIYGLPRSWHPFIIFYNKSMFDREGVPYPDETWTFQDLVRYGRQLTRDTDGNGVLDQFAIGNIPWQVFVWAFGGETFDEKGACRLTDAAAVEGLRFYRDLIWKYEISPKPEQTAVAQNAQDLFKTGRMAMFSLGIWCVPDFREIQDFEWDIAVMPKGKVRVTQLVTAGWGIYTGTPHPNEAWELVKYLSGREAQEYQMRIWRDPSGLKDVFRELMFYEPEEPPRSRQVVLDSIDFGRFAANYLGAAEVNSRIQVPLDEITTGQQQDVAAGAAKIKAVAERTLADLRAVR